MSQKPVVILHGYSDSSKSFQPLARFLNEKHFKVVDLWLADYLSMNDEITIYDLGQAMGKALKRQGIPDTPKSFHAIVHSTGGLVIRAYLNYYFYGKPDKCPIDNLLMLAPAHFGSPLAALGKSMVGRLFNGWNEDHLFQTGTRVLQALELGSPISWELAHRDLFNPENPLFRMQNLFTTILVGSSPYSEKMKQIVHENGSDGTVRVSTANLNARSFDLRFQTGELSFNELKKYYDPIAFGVVYGQNHGSIINPSGESQKTLAELVVESLQIDSQDQYVEHLNKLEKVSQESFRQGRSASALKDRERYHEYQSVTAQVTDQYGESIRDYFLEFFQDDEKGENQVMEAIHGEVLERVRTYSENSSYRSLLFDITDMQRLVLEKGNKIDVNLLIARKSRRIGYQKIQDYLPFVNSQSKNLLHPNGTTFFNITVERTQSEELFGFKKFQSF